MEIFLPAANIEMNSRKRVLFHSSVEEKGEGVSGLTTEKPFPENSLVDSSSLVVSMSGGGRKKGGRENNQAQEQHENQTNCRRITRVRRKRFAPLSGSRCDKVFSHLRSGKKKKKRKKRAGKAGEARQRCFEGFLAAGKPSGTTR